jgi:hypothetical protein
LLDPPLWCARDRAKARRPLLAVGSAKKSGASAAAAPSPGTLMRHAVVYEMQARRSHLRQGESETDEDWE